jgi:hypothetical protein
VKYRVTLAFYVDSEGVDDANIDTASDALAYVEDNITAKLARDYDHVDTEEV